MTTQLSSNQNTVTDEYIQGIQAYLESPALSDELRDFQIENSQKLLSKYKTTLSQSCINYHINKFKESKKQRLEICLYALFITLCFVFMLYQVQQYYQRYYHFDPTQETLKSAIAYFENGDYDEAQPRFEQLLQNGWNDYVIYRDLSYIYQNKGNYKDAANLLCDYLEYCYGLENITSENDAVKTLTNLYSKDGLTDYAYATIPDIIETAKHYTSTYEQVYSYIEEENYTGAEDLCNILKASGANGFYFAACYSNILVNTERADLAYEYVMDLVQDDTILLKKAITPQQRYALVDYIIPYISDDKAEICQNYLYSEFDYSDLPTNTLSPEPYITLDDVAPLFREGMAKYNYLNEIDSISVSTYPTLINAKEYYYIHVIHYEEDGWTNRYFFMDMKQNLYIFLDGEYLPVTEQIISKL